MTTSRPVPGAVIVHGASAERLGDPALATVALLADGQHTDGVLSAVRVTLPDGAGGAQPHRHTRSAELFYLLGGHADVLVGESVAEATAGDMIVVPRDLPHAFAAHPGRPADLLIVLAPGIDRFGYFRLLEQVARGNRPPGDLAAVQDRFDTWFVDSDPWARARAGPPRR